MKTLLKTEYQHKHNLDLNVPPHWKVVPLEKVLSGIIGGGTPSRSKKDYWEGSIPWLTVKDMRSRRPTDSIDHITDAAVKESSTNIIPADTLIIATRVGLGKIIRSPFDAAINQDLKALITTDEIDKDYLEYWFVFIADYLESIGSGTTVKGIRLEKLRSLPVPLAPLVDQKMIVAEIEKQFSRLGEAVTSLKRAKANLKRYKAAILKAAIEGKLTEEWRKQHPDVEPASELLKRILAERNGEWGKGGVSRKGKRKDKELISAISDQIGLPTSWVWSNGAQLFSWSSGKGLTKKNHNIGPYPVYGGNGITGYHDKYLVNHSTLVIGRVGAHCGNVFISDDKAWITDNAIYATRLPLECDLDYLRLMLSEAELNKCSSGSGQPFVNQTILNQTAIPLPPIQEQKQLVSEYEFHLSLISQAEIAINSNFRRVDALRRTILQKAFSGLLCMNG